MTSHDQLRDGAHKALRLTCEAIEEARAHRAYSSGTLYALNCAFKDAQSKLKTLGDWQSDDELSFLEHYTACRMNEYVSDANSMLFLGRLSEEALQE